MSVWWPLAAALWLAVEPADFGLAPAGVVHPRHAREITGSNWSLGVETLDRDYWLYDEGRAYIGPFGAKAARIQGGWAKCEPVRGTYDFAWLDRIVDDLNDQGVRPWLQLSYGNPVYPGGGTSLRDGGLPLGTAEARAGWLAWVGAMVDRYQGKVLAWEVWNEFNWAGIKTEDYVAFYLATAAKVRERDPAAVLYACAMAGTDAARLEAFLAGLKAADGLHLVNTVTFHGYPTNPDSLYGGVARLREVIARYSPTIGLMQGESGAPSTHETSGALRRQNFTEIKQAKWDLRRMLGDLGHDLPSSLFLICDFVYPEGRNSKGLLRLADDRTKKVDGPKPAYAACQRVTAIFDDRLQRVRELTVTGAPGDLAVFGYRRTAGVAALTLWRKVPCADEHRLTPLDLTVTGLTFTDPVLVDLLSGRIFAWPADRLKVDGQSTTLVGLPVYDAPVVLADRALVPGA